MLAKAPAMVRVQHHHGLVDETERVQLRQHSANLGVHPCHCGTVIEPPLARGGVAHRDVGIALGTCIMVGNGWDGLVKSWVQGHIGLMLWRQQGKHRLGEPERQVRLPEACCQKEWLARILPVLGGEAKLHNRIVSNHPVTELLGVARVADNPVFSCIDGAVAVGPHFAGPHICHGIDPLHGQPLAPTGRVHLWWHAWSVPNGVLAASSPLLCVKNLSGRQCQPTVLLEVLRHGGPRCTSSKSTSEATHCSLVAKDAALGCFQLARPVHVSVRPCVAVLILRTDGTTLPTATARRITAPLTTQDLHLTVWKTSRGIATLCQAAISLPKVVDEVVDMGMVRAAASQERIPRGRANSDLTIGVVKHHTCVCKPLHVRRVVRGCGLAVCLHLRPQVIHEYVQHIPGSWGRRRRGPEVAFRHSHVAGASAVVDLGGPAIHLLVLQPATTAGEPARSTGVATSSNVKSEQVAPHIALTCLPACLAISCGNGHAWQITPGHVDSGFTQRRWCSNTKGSQSSHGRVPQPHC
mmetsp:Transcript_82205/g.241360  ORF Transcript_82205/g.241360 Transcript_82205/m.241360 type:complete len:524 (-) Transcript_82205:37-1608(-)